jgi:uncharacterized cysteine cluster protein YcgN (CxxCxxCC family)
MLKRDLSKLNEAEWENLCDGCGRCCLHKVEDETGKVYFTNVVCQYLDEETCKCSEYDTRQHLVANCLKIDKTWLIDTYKFDWLPSTCSYKLAFEGKELPAWHHQQSGDVNAVHYGGISVRGRCFVDAEVGLDNLEEYIVDWVE